MFPDHINEVLNRFGVRADTKAVLYDLYVALGSNVLERFADLCEGETSLAHVKPDDITGLRRAIVDRYVQQNHPRWLQNIPTPSLWHPRSMEGRASGLSAPLGILDGSKNGGGHLVNDLARQILGPSQSVPTGVLMFSKNGHSGGRNETISFDVVAGDIADALEISRAEGQQHTLPGSVGETSGTIDSIRSLALVWEMQPNVLKPAGERNRAIRHVYRRHRNWHVVTLIAALTWLYQRKISTFVVQGQALRWAHELNPAAPISSTVMELHDRTVRLVVEALGAALRPVTPFETEQLLETELMNTALSNYVREHGGAEAIWYVDLSQNTFASTPC